MMTMLRRLNRLPFYTKHLFQPRQRFAEWLWRRQGRPPDITAPHTVKQRIVRDYARRFSLRILVESGTYLGNMVYGMRNDFDRIYSMELDEALFKRAQRLFAREKNVQIIHGDSGSLLPAVVLQLDEPALFWLDGHYAGPQTAKTETESPILRELDPILSSTVDHVILIDDARLFFSRHEDYPAFIDLQDRFYAARPGYRIRVEDDVIQAYRAEEREARGEPRISVTVDGRRNFAFVRVGDGVRVTFALDPGNRRGKPCHLWFWALTPQGSYWYVCGRWVASERPRSHGKFRLFELCPTLLWSTSRPLAAPGEYWFSMIVSEGDEPDFRASLHGCAEVIVTRAGGHADGHDPGGRDRDARFCDRLASMANQAGAGGACQEL